MCADGCLMAGQSQCEGFLQGHHAVTTQQLRKHGLLELRFDTDVGVGLCERHHRRHHNRREPVPYALLPDGVIRFAYEHGVDYLLDRFYGMEVPG